MTLSLHYWRAAFLYLSVTTQPYGVGDEDKPAEPAAEEETAPEENLTEPVVGIEVT